MTTAQMTRSRQRIVSDVPSGYEEGPEGLYIPTAELEAYEDRIEERMQLRDIYEEVMGKAKPAAPSKTAPDERPPPRGFQEWFEPFRPEPRFRVFDRDEVDDLCHDYDSKSVDRDQHSRNKVLLKRIRVRGEYRQLGTLPRGWKRKLDLLEAAFPNFSETIAYLRAMLSLARAADRSVRFDPILLDGPPGIGKSLFAERLADVIGTGLHRVQMESQQSGSPLTGSDEFWGNTKVGAVFEILTDGDYANPLFFVDEIDKAAGDPRYDPAAGLYGLLEPTSAKAFRDLSMPRIRLNASRVLWLFTSNYANRIPAPIRSRLRIFKIPAPDRAQARAIANNVYRRLLNDRGMRRFQPLTEEVLAAMAGASPREMRLAFAEALGRAVAQRRRHIAADDLPMKKKPSPSQSRTALRPVGFQWNSRSLALFLDFDGVLHPDDAGEIIIEGERWEMRGERLFCFLPVLQELLDPFAEVGIVVTSTWRRHYNLQELQELLGERLGERVIGATPTFPGHRFSHVAAYIAAHGVYRWIAIDDERHWPEEMRDRVVITHSKLGLGDPGAVKSLRELLARFGNH